MPPLAEPILELNDIQGNVFPGFMKSHQHFVGLRIDDVGAAKTLLRMLAPQVATAAEVYQFNQLRKALLARRGTKSVSDVLTVVWMNIAMSSEGLKKLIGGGAVDEFEDQAFRVGLHGRSPLLGDPADIDNVRGSPRNWNFGGTAASTPDIFIILAADDPQQLVNNIAALDDTLSKVPGVTAIYRRTGDDLPGELQGHEHFGFKDGISQPGIRGRLPWEPHDFLTPREIPDSNPEARLYSKPGQPLVWPGQFVFGYSTQDALVPEEPQEPRVSAPAWARNGSLLVIRQLEQNVALFWQAVSHLANDLSAQNGLVIGSTELASMFVGRWPSGAPLLQTPAADDVAFAADPINNHFVFARPGPAITLVSGNTLRDAPADPEGLICPHAAHIRKVNPRELTTETGSSTEVLTRRVLRRGIPYGPAFNFARPEDPDAANGDRGLMFLCYQTSIESQFESLTGKWMNTRRAPEEDPGGHDVLLGQSRSSQGNTRNCTLQRRVDGMIQRASFSVTADWITPRGGAYLFVPPISALLSVLVE